MSRLSQPSFAVSGSSRPEVVSKASRSRDSFLAFRPSTMKRKKCKKRREMTRICVRLYARERIDTRTAKVAKSKIKRPISVPLSVSVSLFLLQLQVTNKKIKDGEWGEDDDWSLSYRFREALTKLAPRGLLPSPWQRANFERVSSHYSSEICIHEVGGNPMCVYGFLAITSKATSIKVKCTRSKE